MIEIFLFIAILVPLVLYKIEGMRAQRRGAAEAAKKGINVEPKSRFFSRYTATFVIAWPLYSSLKYLFGLSDFSWKEFLLCMVCFLFASYLVKAICRALGLPEKPLVPRSDFQWGNDQVPTKRP